MRQIFYKIIGMVQWAVTFINKEGNISHSHQGAMFYGAEEPDDEMSDTQRNLVKEFVSTRYEEECDEFYGFRVWIMECTDVDEE